VKKIFNNFIILISIFGAIGPVNLIANSAVQDYAKIKIYLKDPKSYIAIVWPLVPLEADLQIEDMLHKYGKILHKSSIMLSKTDASVLLRTAHPHILNTADHVGWYFPPGAFERPARVYIVQFNNLDIAVETKHKIRRLFNLQYRAIHINDTRSETKALGKFFFKH
jgi:hypothetical protein